MAKQAPKTDRKRYNWDESAIRDLAASLAETGAYSATARWFQVNRPGAESFTGALISLAAKRYLPDHALPEVFGWTPHNVERLKRLRRKGATPARVQAWFRRYVPMAADLGLNSVKSAWRRWPVAHRGAVRGVPGGFSAKACAAIEADYVSGLTYKEVVARHDGKWNGRALTIGLLSTLQQYFGWTRTTGHNNQGAGAAAYQMFVRQTRPVDIVYEPQVSCGVSLLALEAGHCRAVIGYAGSDARYCGTGCAPLPKWARKPDGYDHESFCPFCRVGMGMSALRHKPPAVKVTDESLSWLSATPRRKAA